MKTCRISLLISPMVFCTNLVLAQEAGQSVTLQYGTVESVKLVHNDGKKAGGAVVGGLVGGAIAHDHRGLGMLAGGLIGGSVQKHHTEKTLNLRIADPVREGAEVVSDS